MKQKNVKEKQNSDEIEAAKKAAIRQYVISTSMRAYFKELAFRKKIKFLTRDIKFTIVLTKADFEKLEEMRKTQRFL